MFPVKNLCFLASSYFPPNYVLQTRIGLRILGGEGMNYDLSENCQTFPNYNQSPIYTTYVFRFGTDKIRIIYLGIAKISSISILSVPKSA